MGQRGHAALAAKEAERDRQYLCLLIIMICGSCLLIFHSFVFGDEDLVFSDIGGDTREQYIMWYNTIANHIRAGNWSAWDFSNGPGANIWTYNLTNPFLMVVYLIGALFGPEQIAGTMVYVVIAEILLAGIFCYQMLGEYLFPSAQGKESRIPAAARILTSFAYAFNGYLVVWGQHYQLGAVCVFMPLLIMFSERMIRQRRAWVWVSGISALIIFNGYYQGYMIFLCMGLYLIGRILIYEDGPFPEKLKLFLEEILAMILGILIGAVNLLPGAANLMVSSRLNDQTGILTKFLRNLSAWGREYYRTLVYRFFGSNLQGAGSDFVGSGNYYEAPSVSMSVLFIISLLQFLPIWLREKQNVRKRIALCLGFLSMLFMLLVKAGSLVFNGFAYAFSRHTFLLLPFFAILMAWTLGKMMEERRISRPLLILTCFITTYVYAVAYRNYTAYVYETNALLLLLCAVTVEAALWLYADKRKDRKFTVGVITGAMVICVISDTSLSYNGRDTVKKSDSAYFQETYDGDTRAALSWIRSQDDQFYRVEKDYSNAAAYLESMAQGYRGVSTYNSQQNGDILTFAQKLWPQLYTGYDRNHLEYRNSIHDLTLSSIAGVRYLLSHEEDLGDPGWTLVHQEGSVYVYQNREADHIARFYTGTATEESWEAVAGKTDRYDLLSQVLILSEPEEGQLDEQSLRKEYAHQEIKDAVRSGSAASSYESGMISIPLNEGIYSEYEHVSLSLTAEMEGAGDITIRTGDTRACTYHFNGKGKHAFYLEVPSGTEKISIQSGREEDVIKVSRLHVYGSSRDRASSKDAQITVYCNGNDSLVNGTVQTDTEGYLLLAIPYQDGWKAYVDGQEVKINRADYGLCALKMTQGAHTFTMRYEAPLLKEGAIISLAAVLFWIAAVMTVRKSRKRSDKIIQMPAR